MVHLRQCVSTALRRFEHRRQCLPRSAGLALSVTPPISVFLIPVIKLDDYFFILAGRKEHLSIIKPRSSQCHFLVI